MSADEERERHDAELAELVRSVIAPLVAVDHGQIEWVGVHQGVAEVKLGGGCAGCPGQSFTASEVILPLLRKVDPTIASVRVSLLF